MLVCQYIQKCQKVPKSFVIQEITAAKNTSEEAEQNGKSLNIMLNIASYE